MSKILINVPFLNLRGGVSSHYKGLRDHLGQDVDLNQVGKRTINGPRAVILIDLLKFYRLCRSGVYDKVLLNPSLQSSALMRDYIFLLIAKYCGLKVIVFIHGWSEKCERLIDRIPRVFVFFYFRADKFLVLASSFKRKIVNWGFTAPVTITTTKVDDKLLNYIPPKARKGVSSLLFLARIEQEKGVEIAIETFEHIQKKYLDMELRIVGDGSFLETAKGICKHKKLNNVTFTGQLSGKDLANEFSRADLYLFPTYHGEGMPTSVLEAMAFGLVVLTRPVAGIPDFFEVGKMGYLEESLDSLEFCRRLETIIENKDGVVNRISNYNIEYALKRFIAPKVALNLLQEVGKV